MRRYDQLTPRVARCSTPPGLKASFSSGGVIYGMVDVVAVRNVSVC
ncbi:hypothetical protein [Escherichia coli]|nr:hypothetical protein [Escherichia coli]